MRDPSGNTSSTDSWNEGYKHCQENTMSMTPALPQKINQSAESIGNNLSFKWNICTAGNATVQR